MLHICNNCKHRYIPESPYDFFKKTFDMPDMCKWGDKNYEPEFWLCDSIDVSKINYSSNKLIMKQCITQNFYGTCPYFKTENAIDINRKEVFIDSDDIDCFIDDEVVLKVSTKDFETSDTTEDTTEDTANEIGSNNKSDTTYDNDDIIEDKEADDVIQNEDEKTDNLPNDNETPVEEEIEEPAITFKYQWYKNGRKLFNEKKDSIIINTKNESSDEYYCAVTESIEDNGDGGTKIITVNTNTVIVTVSEKTETEAPSTPPINNDKDEEVNDETGTTEDIQP